MRKMHGLLWLALAALASTKAEDWQPIARRPTVTYHGKYFKDRPFGGSLPKILNRGPSPSGYSSATKLTSLSHVPPMEGDTCNVYKVSMNQELIYQYMEYQKDVPDLKEFTLCMWTKFHNHSEDHPLFSYAVGDSSKEISSWISNTEQASYYSMAIAGHTFFRLNYPLKLNTWYHSCQSWNGKTGEWQVWVNGERVGRGFHNRLVGHVIRGGGVAISGQDQSQLYANKDGVQPPIKQGAGLMGEITLLQLYHVALTAGKAHKDHKHHHVHHFKHDGTPLEQTPASGGVPEPPPPQATPIGNGAFLIGGQLMRPGNLNVAGPQQPQQPQTIPAQLPNGLQLQQQYINGQLGNRIVAEQLLNSASVGQLGTQPATNQYLSSYPARPPVGPSEATTVLLSGSLLNPANVQYIDDTLRHSLFRRDSMRRDKRENLENEDEVETGKKTKRGLVALSDGSIVDDSLLSHGDQDVDQALLQQSLLSGLAGFDGNLPVQNIQKERADEREPAEAEVKAVMDVCSGCATEPFKKALVLSWKDTPKKLYSGAHYYRGLPICKAF